MAAINEVDFGSPERRRLSTTGLGGSEIGAVAGVDPYSGPWDVWESRVDPQPDNDNHHTRRGKFLEPGLRKWLEHELQKEIDGKVEIIETGVLASDDPLCFASPDGIVTVDGERYAAAELKFPSPRTGGEWWDDEGDLIIPDRYVCQNAWEMKAAGLDRGIVAACLGGDLEFKWQNRDHHGLEADLLDIARSFWGYVERGEAPPAHEPGEGVTEFLTRRFPRNKLDLLSISDMEPAQADRICALVRKGRGLAATIKTDEAALDAVKNELRQFIGAREGIALTPTLGRITWKNNKDSNRVSQDQLVQNLLQNLPENERDAALEAATKAATVTVPGSRVFRIGKNPKPKAPRKTRSKKT